MNAYYIQDRLEAQSWARHYQQIAREEKEPYRPTLSYFQDTNTSL